MKKIIIEHRNIKLKNLISGPAPTGRILNYLYQTGTVGLKHINGNRKTSLSDNVGDAWCIEFMIGLGLVRLGNNPIGSTYKLELTESGKKLFNFIKNNPVVFDEGFHSSNIVTLKQQINNCHPDFYQTFKDIFTNTYPFLILKEYLKENGYSYDKRTLFNKDFFEAVADLYGENAREAGFNRVPSLIQLCELFGFVVSGRSLNFIKSRFETSNSNIAIYEYDNDELVEEASNAEKVYDLSYKQLKKYGEKGTIMVSAEVRNPDLQKKYKNNLSIKQNHKCVICGISTSEMLLGSHIKEASKCNVTEKADIQNGLLLCANHDKLFDRHLISFNPESGLIQINEKMIKDGLDFLNLDKNFTLPSYLLTPERVKYLKIHYNIFLDKATD